MRILLVDDNIDLLVSLGGVLRSAGYEVEAVNTGEAALQAQQGQPADLLITDIFMPDQDGLEIIAAFRSRWPAIRIIAISGGGRLATGNYLEAAARIGADTLLQKPFDPARLLSMVSKLLK